MPQENFDYSLKVFAFTMSSLTKMAKIQNEALLKIASCEMSVKGEIEMKTTAQNALVEVFKIGREAEETIKQN